MTFDYKPGDMVIIANLSARIDRDPKSYIGLILNVKEERDYDESSLFADVCFLNGAFVKKCCLVYFDKIIFKRLE